MRIAYNKVGFTTDLNTLTTLNFQYYNYITYLLLNTLLFNVLPNLENSYLIIINNKCW